MQVALRALQVFRFDILDVVALSKQARLSKQSEALGKNFWLLKLALHLELAYLCYSHFYIFNVFDSLRLYPCVHLQMVSGKKMVWYDSTKYIMSGQAGLFVRQQFFSFVLIGCLVMVAFLFQIAFWRYHVQYFRHPFSLTVYVGLLYVAGSLLITRIGILNTLSPTPVRDEDAILRKLIATNAKYVFCIVPEVLETLFLLTELFLCAILKKLQDALFQRRIKQYQAELERNKLFEQIEGSLQRNNMVLYQ